MAKHARHWAPLSLALVMLSFCLVACQAPSSVEAQGKTKPLAFSTAVGGTSSVTPTLLTVGVWASITATEAHATATPGARDTIADYTIYIVCMVQDPAQGTLIGPAAGLQARVRLTGPITQSYTGTTSSNGIAQVHVNFTDAQPGKPVTVTVATTWHGVAYQAQTFLMPGEGATSSPTPSPSPSPSVPSPSVTPSPGNAPTTTPEPTTAPEPTATTAPEPTATTGP